MVVREWMTGQDGLAVRRTAPEQRADLGRDLMRPAFSHAPEESGKLFALVTLQGPWGWLLLGAVW